MATPEKPTRLGRGLDALLSRREVPRPPDVGAPATPAIATAVRPANPFATPLAAASEIDTATSIPGHPSVATPTSSAPETASTDRDAIAGLRVLQLAQIAPNPFQPRKEFRPEDLADLESSLRVSGLLQPITVRPSPHHTGYELIAGERRLRAATRLGWKEIPAMVRPTDDRTMLTLAMVENLQRADLDPVEEADGYQRLVDEFSLTQQEVADVVGKDRSTIANALRLLALPASVKR